MDNKDKAFAKKAFADAIKATRMDQESRAASKSFEEYFSSLLAAFVVSGNGSDFLKRNSDAEGTKAVSNLAEICFYAGFRSGVLYQSKKKQ